MVQYGPRRLKPGAAGPPMPSDTMQNIQLFKGVFWFNNNWLPPDMILNATDGTGSIIWSAAYVFLDTGTTSGGWAAVAKDAEGLTAARSWDKKRFFGLGVFISSFSDQIFHLVTGYVTDLTAATNTDRHVGFKLIDGDLYGTVGDGTSESVLLLETLTEAVWRTLECVFIPGVECRFYVNGVDKGAITSNLPDGTTDADYMLFATVINTADSAKGFHLYESRTLQVE